MRNPLSYRAAHLFFSYGHPVLFIFVFLLSIEVIGQGMTVPTLLVVVLGLLYYAEKLYVWWSRGGTQ